MKNKEKEFEGKFKDYFCQKTMICKKCGHNKLSHYWNGGGDSRTAGWDRCREANCKCIEYDEKNPNDWVEKIVSVDETYDDIKNFIFDIIEETRICINAEIDCIQCGDKLSPVEQQIALTVCEKIKQRMNL